VDDIAQAPSVTRELALIKVAATPRNRSQIFELVEVFRARIVDLAPESLMIEMTGVESKIEGLIQVLNEERRRILEICRSGKMTMRRGHHTSGVLKAMGAGENEPSRRPSRGNFEDGACRRAGITRQSAAKLLRSFKPINISTAKQRKIREKHGKDLLRSRCRPIPHPSQEGSHHRLRLAGHAHALNLKDSGVQVKVGLRPSNSKSIAKAQKAGLKCRHRRRSDQVGRRGDDPGARSDRKAKLYAEEIGPT
jgi:hypothetical protein